MDPQSAQQPPSSSGVKKALLFLIIVLVVIVLAGVAFLVLKGEPTPKEPQTLTGLEKDAVVIGYSVPVVGIFPDSDLDFNNVVFNNNIFEGLGRIVGGQVKPALATSWSNPDKNTWRFNLRKDVKFHNGDSFTAGDVKFSIDTAKKEKWPNAFNLSTVGSVKVVDESTVEIKTASPDPVLLNRLVFAFVVSEKQFKTKGDKPAVGTGPYKLVSLDENTGVLEANTSHYLGAPKVKKVTYKFFDDDATDGEKSEALRKGEVDLLSIEDKKLAESLVNTYQVKSISLPFIAFLWLDTDRDKSAHLDKTPNPLKNKDVRQAIYKVINTGQLIEDSGLSAAPASQFVTEAIFGFNPNITRPNADVQAAQKLMEEAGYKDGFNLTIDTIKGREKEVEALAKQLEKINIKAKARGIEGGSLEDTLFVGRDTSAFVLDYGAETFDSGEIFTDVLGLANYSNSEIDKLVEEIVTTFDTRTRQEKLQETMTKVMEELPLIPLYSKEFSYVIDNDVDWTPTAFGAIYAGEISGRQVTP